MSVLRPNADVRFASRGAPCCALEIILGGDDVDADTAERYAWASVTFELGVSRFGW